VKLPVQIHKEDRRLQTVPTQLMLKFCIFSCIVSVFLGIVSILLPAFALIAHADSGFQTTIAPIPSEVSSVHFKVTVNGTRLV
jgi:hypothetical protein